MRYILIDEKRRQNAIDELKGMDISTVMQVDIKPYKKNRSNSQNNLYWSWLPDIAKHFGYTEEELHEQLKVQFLGIEEKVVAGKALIQPISTATLKTKPFSEYLRKIEALAEANDIRLRRPDDYNLALGYK